MDLAWPDSVKRLLWEFDTTSIPRGDLTPILFERVMTRGGLEDMRWLLHTFDRAELRAYVEREGALRFPPRELAFWGSLLGVDPELLALADRPGGGRPSWADR